MVWFDCKVVYYKEEDLGKGKKKRKRVSESYLVEAMSFAQAEDRISEETAKYVSEEFTVAGLRKAAINEIFPNDEGDKLYKCKVAFMSIDEVSGVEKKIKSVILVFGSDIDMALKNLYKNMSDCLDVFEVLSVSETPYLDLYPLEVPAEEKRGDNKTKEVKAEEEMAVEDSEYEALEA